MFSDLNVVLYTGCLQRHLRTAELKLSGYAAKTLIHNRLNVLHENGLLSCKSGILYSYKELTGNLLGELMEEIKLTKKETDFLLPWAEAYNEAIDNGCQGFVVYEHDIDIEDLSTFVFELIDFSQFAINSTKGLISSLNKKGAIFLSKEEKGSKLQNREFTFNKAVLEQIIRKKTETMNLSDIIDIDDTDIDDTDPAEICDSEETTKRKRHHKKEPYSDPFIGETRQFDEKLFRIVSHDEETGKWHYERIDTGPGRKTGSCSYSRLVWFFKPVGD